MLLFPILIGIIVLGISGFWAKYLISLNKRWKIKIAFESDEDKEAQVCYLKHQQKIALGDDSLNAIYCPGDEVRGYLQRKGNRLYLIPLKNQPIFYRQQEIKQAIPIERNNFRLNCPFKDKNFDLAIKVTK